MATAITLAAIETFLEAGTAAEARTALGLGTGDSPQFTTVKIGGTDVILKRLAAASVGIYAADGTTLGKLNCDDLAASGVVTFSGLPISDPTVAGQLWNNSGVLTVSAG